LARTVLLADDSVTAQNMGRRILMDAGYEVITVNNGSAALKKIHEKRPDLIVLDVYMPGYGGLEVCQRLKESGDTMRIPVLLTVGKMEPFKTDEAKRVRADGHIVKPFEASELLAALTRLEDRIVPQAEVGRKKPAEKKTRLWRMGDPEPESFSQAENDKVAYLAQIKERQSQSHDSDSETQEAESSPAPESQVASSIPSSNSRQTEHAAPESQESRDEIASSSATTQPATFEEPVAEFSVQSRAEEPDNESAPPELIAEKLYDPKEETGTAHPSAHSHVAEEPSVTLPAEAPVTVETQAPRWMAESVPLTAEESSVALEHEMQQAIAPAEAVAATEARSALVEENPQPPADFKAIENSSENTADAKADSVSVPEETNQENGAAFAAAASVGAVAAAAASKATESLEAEPPQPSEAAAAWQNWQQIRDKVMAPQQTAAIADSVAEVVKSAAPVNASSTDDLSTDQLLRAGAIASIVDSVLAELKPKLMEEIAKKMSQGKKDQ